MSPEPARILIADDHESVLADFAQLLDAPVAAEAAELDALEDALGGAAAVPAAIAPRYHVRYVRNGADAVREAAAASAAGRPFAVAFVDVQMPPGIDGVETAAQLWRDHPELEIVLCTAYTDYSWQAIAARLPTPDQLVILRKPFEPIEIRQLAACLSEKWRRGRALAQRVLALEARVAKAARVQIELERAQKFDALGRLAAGIAHEINTPIQYIQSSLEYLDDAFAKVAVAVRAQRARLVASGADDPACAAIDALLDEVPGSLADAGEGVRRVCAIVRGIRDYAHPCQRQHDAVDLNRQIRVAAELARCEYRHDAELVLDLGELPLVPGNADELGSAIVNLLVNAAQAVHARRTGTMGRITITSRATPDLVTIDVADTGTGIAPEDRERVFEPFFTTKAIGEGTGQGLAIARATIVDGHHGTLTFDSELGRGTVFHLRLPVARR
jgi:two-component system NtrC family sensor kinase